MKIANGEVSFPVNRQKTEKDFEFKKFFLRTKRDLSFHKKQPLIVFSYKQRAWSDACEKATGFKR